MDIKKYITLSLIAISLGACTNQSAAAYNDKKEILISDFQSDSLLPLAEAKEIQQEDTKSLRKTLQSLCDKGKYIACYNLAIMMAKGTDGEVDLNGSKMILSDLCTKDYNPACKSLIDDEIFKSEVIDKIPSTASTNTSEIKSEIFVKDKPIYTQRQLEGFRAVNQYRCQKSDADSCYRLAYMMAAGSGGQLDAKGAYKILYRLCDNNYNNACNVIARANKR